MNYQLEAVTTNHDRAFIAYCQEHGPSHDASFLPKDGYLPGPSVALLDHSGAMAGGLSLYDSPALAAAGKLRIAFIHSTGGEAGYRALVGWAKSMAPPGIHRLFLFLPRDLPSPGDYLLSLGFRVERVALAMARPDLSGPEATLEPGWSLESLGRDDSQALMEFRDVRNRNFATVPGAVATSLESWQSVAASPDTLPGGLVLLRDPRGQARGSLLVEAEAPEIDAQAISIAALSVDPDLRGRGLGLALLRKAYALGRAAGYERASLSVDESNKKALALYKDQGFVLSKAMAQWTMDLEAADA